MRRPAPELVWPGKKVPPHVPPVSLVEVPALGRAAADGGPADNRLVHGDNLPVLEALRADLAGRVQCAYLDPPYNTRAGVSHYDDDADDAEWLGFMYAHLVRLRPLLADSGVVFVSIDDAQAAYMTLLMDEVFGRRNACGPLVWEKKRKPSFLDGRVGGVTETILAYAGRREAAPPFVGGTTTRGKKYPLNNAGNPLGVLAFPAGAVHFGCADQVFEPQDMSEGRVVTRLLDRVEVRDHRNVGPFRLEGEWRYTQATLDRCLAAGDRITISRAPFRPNHVRAGGAPKKLKNLLSAAHYPVGTYEDATEESRRLFGEAAFHYPKPESLIGLLVRAVTRPGDLVLDPFAGSGTTGAVAHKLGRRWVMIEIGPQCDTHIVPRMRQVIDGTDRGGIGEEVGWRGGGGYRYFRAVPVVGARATARL
ncbi:MAG TPA: site-specific DNA-methyltransferase [Thermodesulfobacteriota bacterium]